MVSPSAADVAFISPAHIERSVGSLVRHALELRESAWSLGDQPLLQGYARARVPSLAVRMRGQQEHARASARFALDRLIPGAKHQVDAVGTVARAIGTLTAERDPADADSLGPRVEVVLRVIKRTFEDSCAYAREVADFESELDARHELLCECLEDLSQALGIEVAALSRPRIPSSRPSAATSHGADPMVHDEVGRVGRKLATAAWVLQDQSAAFAETLVRLSAAAEGLQLVWAGLNEGLCKATARLRAGELTGPALESTLAEADRHWQRAHERSSALCRAFAGAS